MVQFFLQREALERGVPRSLALVPQALHELGVREEFVGGLSQVQVSVARARDKGSELLIYQEVGAFFARR